MFSPDYSSSNRFLEEQTDSNLSLKEILQANANFIDYRETQSKTSAIIKFFSGIISILASCALIWMIRRSHLGLSTTYHRLILGLCVSDLIYTSCFPLLNIPVPSDLDYLVWNARGNTSSCNFMGTTITVGKIIGLYYHCSLNIFYIAVIKFEKSDEYIRSKIEPFLHAFPIILSIVFGIIRFVNKNYNDSGFGTCRATTYHPPHCKYFDNGVVPDGFDIPCGRGHTEQDNRRIITTFSVCIIPLFFVFISLAIIYVAVVKQERKLSKYGIGSKGGPSISSLRRRCNLDSGRRLKSVGDSDNINASAVSANESIANNETLETNSFLGRLKRSVERAVSSLVSNFERKSHKSNSTRSKSRTVMYKAMAYSLSYLTSNLAFLIMFFLTIVKNNEYLPSKGLVYCYNVTDPLSGFFNFIVFVYPAVIRLKSSKKNKLSWYQAFVQAFWSKGAKRKNQGRLRAVRSRPTNHSAKPKTSVVRYGSRMLNPSSKSAGKNSVSFGVSKISMPAKEKYKLPESTTSENVLQSKSNSNQEILLSSAADGDTSDDDVDEKDREIKRAEDIEDPLFEMSQGPLSEGGKNRRPSRLSTFFPGSKQSSASELHKMSGLDIPSSLDSTDVSAERNRKCDTNVAEECQNMSAESEELIKKGYLM